jgi:hypothetical protein
MLGHDVCGSRHWTLTLVRLLLLKYPVPPVNAKLFKAFYDFIKNGLRTIRRLINPNLSAD